MLTNDVNLRINKIDQMDTYIFSWQKNKFPPQQTPSKIAYSGKYAFALQTRLIKG